MHINIIILIIILIIMMLIIIAIIVASMDSPPYPPSAISVLLSITCKSSTFGELRVMVTGMVSKYDEQRRTLVPFMTTTKREPGSW